MGPAPPWDELRVFLATARAGSLVAAAATLRLSGATVGRRLRALEARLGARLFDRLPNRVALTPLGERLVAAAAAMDEGAADFARLARAGGGDGPGGDVPVRVTATGSVALFVTRHLARVLAEAPGVRLQLHGTRATLDLRRGEADIALRMRRPPERGDLVVSRIGRIAFGLYAAEDGRVGRQEPAGPGAAGRPAFIGLRDDPGSRQSRWLDAAAGAAPMPVRLDDVHLRLDAARRGLGATLLPCFLGDAEPRLRRLAPPPAELAEDVFLLAHADLTALPPIAAVRRALARLFRDEAAALAGAEPVRRERADDPAEAAAAAGSPDPPQG